MARQRQNNGQKLGHWQGNSLRNNLLKDLAFGHPVFGRSSIALQPVDVNI
jgi:hypothetical protein